jgi:hypothetical protein
LKFQIKEQEARIHHGRKSYGKIAPPISDLFSAPCVSAVIVSLFD